MTFISDEIQRQIIMCDAKIIITYPSVHSTIKEALFLSNKHIPIICLDVEEDRPQDTISFTELTDKQTDLSILKNVKRSSTDVAVLLCSSGTTGLPKAVEWMNRNIISNCEQQNTELRQYEYTTGNTVLLKLKLFGAYLLFTLN